MRVITGDCLEVMSGLAADSIDAIVTDPPYGLGFMGKAWDHGVPGVPFWAAALRVLKPGGYLLAFGGTRTQHRMVCAIEDAGFEIRDQIGWAYGSGMPKSKTVLKPAWEPICVARKAGPLRLNVEACRVEAPDGVPKFTHRGEDSANCYGDGKNGSNRTGEIDTSTGRWPANLVHDGSEEVLAAFPQAPGQIAKESSSSSRKDQNVYGTMARGSAGREPRADSGSAARFFYCAKASRSERGEGNDHPTVKPVALMRWLVRLVTPPSGTVLDPFAGSGTTGLAAQAEGVDAVLIEQDPHHVEIINARLGLVDVFA